MMEILDLMDENRSTHDGNFWNAVIVALVGVKDSCQATKALTSVYLEPLVGRSLELSLEMARRSIHSFKKSCAVAYRVTWTSFLTF